MFSYFHGDFLSCLSLKWKFVNYRTEEHFVEILGAKV